MNKLNYNIHLLLTSKYKIFINLFIIFVIYSFLYGNKIIYCMNDNINSVETPIMAEAKASARPSHQVQALMEEIRSYTGSQLHLLENIEQKEVLITRQEDRIKHLEEILAQKDGRAFRLYREIDDPSNGTGYKQQIEYYKDQVIHFSNNERIANGNLFMRTKELERANALLAEAKQNISFLEKRCRELERLNRI